MNSDAKEQYILGEYVNYCDAYSQPNISQHVLFIFIILSMIVSAEIVIKEEKEERSFWMSGSLRTQKKIFARNTTSMSFRFCEITLHGWLLSLIGKSPLSFWAIHSYNNSKNKKNEINLIPTFKWPTEIKADDTVSLWLIVAQKCNIKHYLFGGVRLYLKRIKPDIGVYL